MSNSPFKSDCLLGKVALITGGGSGIGYEITRQLGLHGCRVSIMGRRQNALKEACDHLSQDGISCRYSSGDVRKFEDCENAVKECVSAYGNIHILVNCAAGNFLSPAEQLSSNAFRTVLEIDTLGTFNVSKAAYESMTQLPKSDRVIINISATLQYGATWYQAHASAAKSAVDSLTRSLALEWGPAGIRVVGVAPGPIGDTVGLAKLAPGANDSFAQMVPVGRLGTRADIGLSCVYLCSVAGSYVSGETLVVDGAQWMWKPPLIPKAKVSRAARAVEATSRNAGAPQARSKL